MAFDDAGWSTLAPTTVKLRMNSREKLPKVEMLEGQAITEKKYVQLNWDYAPREDVKFILYKSIDGGPWLQYELLSASTRAHKDRLARPGQEIGYFIQVVTTKGRDSDYSPRVKVRM
jgi:hypothetical protein